MIKVLYPNYKEPIEEEINFHKFSGGEWHVHLGKKEVDNSPITIYARLTSADNIMQLLLLTDALKSLYLNKIDLILPYIPYGRQDRYCQEGDAFSLKVFAKLINSQCYSRVITADPHSQVSLNLISNLEIIPQKSLIKKIDLTQYDYLIAPDAGSLKRVTELADNKLPVIYCSKKRDELGNIISTSIESIDNISGKKGLIIDDICDGGRTFIEISKILKEQGMETIHLFVTHGIFSHGIMDLVESGIDHIYSTDSITDLRPVCNYSTVYKFF